MLVICYNFLLFISFRSLIMASQIPTGPAAYGPDDPLAKAAGTAVQESAATQSEQTLYIENGCTFFPLIWKRLEILNLRPGKHSERSNPDLRHLAELEQDLRLSILLKGQGPANNRLMGRRYSLIEGASTTVEWVPKRSLGQGSWGVVHEIIVIRKGLISSIAVKFMTGEADSIPSFAREVWALTKANALDSHERPRIVRVLNFGRIGNCLWYSMPVFRQSLKEAISARTLTIADICRITSHLFEALEILGRVKLGNCEGIVHADIKPDNVLLDEKGNAHLADFGLATLEARLYFKTYITTRWYRAPEIIVNSAAVKGSASANQVTASIDMWGVGITICEMLKGRPLWVGENHIDQWQLIANSLGPVPALLREGNGDLGLATHEPDEEGMCRPKHWTAAQTAPKNWLERHLGITDPGTTDPRLVALTRIAKWILRWVPAERPSPTEARLALKELLASSSETTSGAAVARGGRDVECGASIAHPIRPKPESLAKEASPNLPYTIDIGKLAEGAVSHLSLASITAEQEDFFENSSMCLIN